VSAWNRDCVVLAEKLATLRRSRLSSYSRLKWMEQLSHDQLGIS